MFRETKTSTKVIIFAWGLSASVSVLAVIAWAQSYSWFLGELTAYKIFPLFGLLAFSLMWAHYIAGAMREYVKADKQTLKLYFESTSLLVLVFILLHPGLLLWSLWRDGLGLPPGSAQYYVGESAYWAIVLGAIALCAFLAYELHRWHRNKSWWKYIQYSSDAAMFLILVHGLRLGGALRIGWYRGVWYFYGASLVLVLYKKYAIDRRAGTLVKSD